MLKELLDLKQQYLTHFFEELDLEASNRILETLLACKGKIFLTGVGKSGLIAKKIAVTMTSTGTHALYLSPTDAMHGDLGILTSQDLFIFLSKSGESDELLNLVPHIRNKGAKLIAVVSDPKSRLAHLCHQSITLPLKNELCPFGLAPTTSTSIQMIFGDLLAVALMRKKKFTIDEYALNHPAGRIGKRITVKVQDLMLTGDLLPTCRGEDTLMSTLVILSNKRCGCILIVDGESNLKGIFTDGDLRRALQKNGAVALESKIEQLMTRSPKSIGPDELAWEALKKMEAHPSNEITVLPVVENGTLLGLIRLHDIVQAGI
jgi:arabinose-5-phosphate isomerase